MAEVIVRALDDGSTEVDWHGGCVWVEASGELELNLGDRGAYSTIPAPALAALVEHHPATADLRRRLEQARSVAVQLEQQLARVTAAVDGLVDVEPGQIWWVSTQSGAAVELGEHAVRTHLHLVLRAVQEADRG